LTTVTPNVFDLKSMNIRGLAMQGALLEGADTLKFPMTARLGRQQAF
jgi:hypothetical protein